MKTRFFPRFHRAVLAVKFSVRVLGVLLFIAWHVATASAQETVAPEPGTTAQSDAATAKPEANVPTEPDESLYVRVHRDEESRPLSLQTAIVRFVGKPGTEFAGKTVDLVGVVHVGQAEYYEQLDQLLDTYDTVLYELVAPDGTRIKPEDLEKRRSLLASVQTGMKDMLNLEYQLEKIDYMAENFRHADMSPEEFSEDLASRGDSVWKMVARMMGAGIATQSKNGGDVGMLMALFSSERAKLMKQAMAKQLVDIELVTAGMDDASGNNTLIKGRNRKCFEILRDELDQGTETVAVFYGAGHLADMAERLETEFDMQPESTKWFDAWDLTRN